MSSSNLCPSCGNPNNCQSHSSACWCFSLPPLLSPALKESCYCKSCLIKALRTAADGYVDGVKSGARKNEANKYYVEGQQAVEGLDYDLENEMLVFSAWYLLKRAYCCENQCRNCPY